MPNLMKFLAFDALDAVTDALPPYWKYCAECDGLTNHTTAQHEAAAAELPEEPRR